MESEAEAAQQSPPAKRSKVDHDEEEEKMIGDFIGKLKKTDPAYYVFQLKNLLGTRDPHGYLNFHRKKLLLYENMRNPVEERDLGHVKHISHDEILKLTEDSSHYIQNSPYGRLFRGRMMGKDVLVKKWDFPLTVPIPRYSWDYPQRFASQLEFGLNKVVASHSKVAKLIGFCCEKILALVWDLKLNRTLHDLVPQDSFTWDQRMKVAGQVAETLNFFHNQKIAICNFFSPCISVDQDYNIQLFELDYSVNLANGYSVVEPTRWWKHPSYYSPESETPKFPDDFQIGWFYASDVYHFGLLLLELLAKCVLNNIAWKWVKSAKKSFEEAGTRKPLDPQVKSIFDLARKCLRGKPMLRPSMADVFLEFRTIVPV